MYYKVVFNDNGIYRSILAGNTKIDEYSELCILPSIKYKVGEYVEHDSPLLVFRSLNDAKKFVRHECLTSFPYKIFSCEIATFGSASFLFSLRCFSNSSAFFKIPIFFSMSKDFIASIKSSLDFI